MPVEVNIMVGGQAGQGVQTVGSLLGKTFCRGGYFVFADQDYESRIRGGHNFFRLRVNERRVEAIKPALDILIALDKASVDLHLGEMNKNGVVIYDKEKIPDLAQGGNVFGLPLERIAQEQAGEKRAANTVAIGAALSLVKYGLDTLNSALNDYFRDDATRKANIEAARAGFDYAREHFKGAFDVTLRPPRRPVKRMFINGNDAISLGAIAAGCKFMAGYPMTPITSILEYMAAKAAEMGMVVVPAEDEISAVNMSIGAGFAGVRAMTATSGSGFCLMTEGLGLAGITETPLVIIEGQRPGPAVGLPTRTEQGDLEFIIHAHQGDFSRAVLAPGNAEQAFWLTVKAFNLAEKYQIPVIVMTDHYLSSSYFSVEPFDMAQVSIERGSLFSPNGAPAADFRRYRDTLTGVSPRAFPGLSEAIVVADGDEHNEEGHLIEDAATRTQQMEKRMRKLHEVRGHDMAPPSLLGPKRAEVTLISWGSNYGNVQEVIDLLRDDGVKANFLHFSEIWPFPAAAAADALRKRHPVYVIENNYSGQLAHLIQAETGLAVGNRILKCDGRPFTPPEIVAQIKKCEGV